MNKIVKKSLKSTYAFTKKVVNSNKQTKRLAKKAKRALRRVLLAPDEREVYNLSSFYPTIQEYHQQSKDFNPKTDPLISILLPTYNTPEVYLRECIDSIIVQSYSNWELCIADDKSPDENVVKIIKEYQAKDKRIKLIERKENGHISQATNSALEIAKGDFVALMDHDDVLWPNALYEMVKVIRANKNVDFIYSDEDKIDGSGKIHSYPFLKPDFSPEFLESCNYITHFSCIRMKTMKQVGGFRKGYEGAQDWDLFIRISEVTTNIVHISKLLYSWRIHEASTASDTDAKPYVYEAQRKLLEDHVERLGKQGTIETGIIRQHRTINYEPQEGTSLTVVIRYSDEAKTKRLLSSFKKHPAGADFDVIYMTHRSIPHVVLESLKAIIGEEITQEAIVAKDDLKTVLARAHGTSLLVLDDDMIIQSDDWARRSLAESQVKGVGFVFPVILDKSGTTVASAGIGLGYGEFGYGNMLSGMPFDDNHYTRGLYAKSRRNVSAGNKAAFVVATKTLQTIVVSGKENMPELCSKFLGKGLRHIYNPYIQVLSTAGLPEHERVSFTGEDNYLNPNFNHSNTRMEVRS